MLLENKLLLNKLTHANNLSTKKTKSRIIPMKKNTRFFYILKIDQPFLATEVHHHPLPKCQHVMLQDSVLVSFYLEI
jgi:hypothetical protein